MNAEKEALEQFSELIKNARAHHQSGQLKEAEEIYRFILGNQSQKPDVTSSIIAEAHNSLGAILAGLYHTQDAIKHFNNALSLNTNYTEAHYNLATALAGLNRTEEAITHYKKALDLSPDLAEAHNNLGALLLGLNRTEEAVTHFKKALSITPHYARAFRNLVQAKPDSAYITKLEQMIAEPMLTDNSAIEYHFALGYLYDKHNIYARAFDHINIANAIKRKSIHYNAKKHSEYVDKLINTYSKKYFEKNIISRSDSALPIFIVGMPRSGTSLIEQIVSSHPRVYGAGELDFLKQVESDISAEYTEVMPYPECMASLDAHKAENYARKYIEKLSSYSSNSSRITDKMPNNFMRVGLIRTLLPNARIIHCQRQAMDTCLSIYFNYFTQGNYYSFDLCDIGEYYLDYQRLMTHWIDIFQTDILNVQYESLVENQEAESRRIIEYLGLEWDARCLAFHKNNRAVTTTSQLQVRKPMYKSAVNKWKSYEENLGPLLAIIQHSN